MTGADFSRSRRNREFLFLPAAAGLFRHVAGGGGPELPEETGKTCAGLVGLILGIIGLNKYPDKSNGKTMSLIAVIVSIVIMLVGAGTTMVR